MLFIEMRKKRVIKKAYEWLHKHFPRNTFLVYWEPHADAFFIRTNDKGLFYSEIYTDFIEQTRVKLFHRSGFSVWFGCFPINGESENVYNAEAPKAQETIPAQS